MISDNTKRELKRLVEVVFENEMLFVKDFFVGDDFFLEEFRVSVSSCEFKFSGKSGSIFNRFCSLDQLLNTLKDNGVTL